MKPMMDNILINYLVYTNGGNKKNPYGDIMRITKAMMIPVRANTTTVIIKLVLVTCKNNITYSFFA